jgi:hypothetical protein
VGFELVIAEDGDELGTDGTAGPRAAVVTVVPALAGVPDGDTGGAEAGLGCAGTLGAVAALVNCCTEEFVGEGEAAADVLLAEATEVCVATEGTATFSGGETFAACWAEAAATGTAAAATVTALAEVTAVEEADGSGCVPVEVEGTFAAETLLVHVCVAGGGVDTGGTAAVFAAITALVELAAWDGAEGTVAGTPGVVLASLLVTGCEAADPAAGTAAPVVSEDVVAAAAEVVVLGCAVGCDAPGWVTAPLATVITSGIVVGFCPALPFPNPFAGETCEAEGGTVPLPGVPIEGKTVPCCRLPKFGWAALGLLLEALVAGLPAAAGFIWPSGSCSGGRGGGGVTGAGSWVSATEGTASCRCGRSLSSSEPPEAAGTGAPLRRPSAIMVDGRTVRVTVLPDVASPKPRASSRSTTTRVTGGFALLSPMRTAFNPSRLTGTRCCRESDQVLGSSRTRRSGFLATITFG